MNKITLMGRLTKDLEMKYTEGNNPLTIAKGTIAVNRRFAKEGQQNADFINITAFGKTAEFLGKYFNKGKMVSLCGRLQVSSYENEEGKKIWKTDVIAEEVYFCGGKNDNNGNSNDEDDAISGFENVVDIDDDELPFN